MTKKSGGASQHIVWRHRDTGSQRLPATAKTQYNNTIASSSLASKSQTRKFINPWKVAIRRQSGWRARHPHQVVGFLLWWQTVQDAPRPRFCTRIEDRKLRVRYNEANQWALWRIPESNELQIANWSNCAHVVESDTLKLQMP
jgi:hypothetical protein